MTVLSAHLGYLFGELPFEERFAAARAAGFSHVEAPSPYALPATRVRELCADHALTFVQMALPAGDPSRGDKGLAGLPDRSDEFRASIETGIAYAVEAEARFVHVMAGVMPAGATREALWPTYVGNIAKVCAAALDADLQVLIEPIGVGTIAGYLLDNPFDGLAVLDEVRAANLHLLFDAFHAKNAGLDPIAFVQEHTPAIGHVHIADHPGRHEPGTGTIDFQRFFDTLEAQGYDGSVGLEYIPATTTLAGLGWRSAQR